MSCQSTLCLGFRRKCIGQYQRSLAFTSQRLLPDQWTLVGTPQLVFQTLKARRKSIRILVDTNAYAALLEPDNTFNRER